MKRVVFLSGAGAMMIGMPARAASLNGRIRSIARRMPGNLGVYARTLAPGPPLATYDAWGRFPTASVIKVLIMTTAYALEEARPGVLSQSVIFHREDLIGGSDFLTGARDGQRFTVAELIVPMITLSDNTAANLLISTLGVQAIDATAARAGMIQTHIARRFLDYTAITNHHDNLSSPADMGHLLYLIELGAHEGIATIVSSQHCRTMLQIMLRQTDRGGIPAALPPRTAVANKTGEITGTRNDVAVVAPFGDSPLVLVVMTKSVGDYAAAFAAIHAVTRAVYSSVSQTSA